MSIPSYSGATNYISSLHDKPITDDNLTAAQFKQKFDQFGTDFKAWFNGTFISKVQEVLSATNKLNGAYITDGTVDAAQLHSKAVTSAKLDDGAALANLAAGSIPSAKLATGAAAGNLADGDVHYAKLNSDAKSTVVDSGITIDKSAWNGGTSVSVTVSGVSAADNIIVSPSTPQQYPGTTYFETWRDYGIRCVSQSDNSLDFACDATPNKSVRFNVLVVR